MRIFRQKYFLIFLFSLLPLILAFGLYRYTWQVDTVLSAITLNTMQEIGSHDRAFIENTLERSCTSLARIGYRLQQENHQNLKELQTQLNLEHNVSAFKYLYLVDSNGKMYSGTFLIQDGTRYSFIQGILKNIPKRILRFDDYNNQIDYQEESIVYALTITPFEVEGIRFIGLVGQTPISDIREHMNRASFDGQGTSMVVDNHGWYVVNKSDKNGIGQHDNLLKSLEQAVFSDENTLVDLQAALKDKEDNILCTYTLKGSTYALSMTKIKGTDWYLAMSVPTTVFAEQSRRFIFLTSGSLGAAILLCILLFFCLLHFWKTSLAAKANAAARYSFLNRMSHEIRTPLNAILGLNHLMRSSLHEPEKLKDYLEKSAGTSEYLLSLINDILDISKLEQSSISMSHESFSLLKMTEDLQNMMKERFAEKGIAFHTEYSLLQPIIFGDEMRLKQVLLNILGNAAKFTPSNGSVHMTISQSSSGPAANQCTISINIQDTGIGMSEEFQKHIFEPFSQEEKKKNQQLSEPSIRGTGLGMAISHMLIRQMGGTLEVKSQLGKGSLFCISLPAELSTAPADSPAAPEDMKKAVQGTKHILIAEDNSLNAEILTEILQQAGFRITLAVNGAQAVEAFAAAAPYTFDCILMDAQMPVMDGYTAAQSIRKLPRADAASIRIYATTANTAPEDRTRAKEAGMNGFIAKPIDVKKLFEAIQTKKECEPS